jgi:hypothetical protein
MSIRVEINHRVEQKRLFRLPRELVGEPVERTMFVSQEVYGAISGPWVLSDTYQMAMLRANLDMFTQGKIISIAEDPYQKPKSTYMARVDPPEDEVWDIRSRDPKPGIRVLGCFAETDTFIALVWGTRKSLGGPRSREWRNLVESCKAEWRKLFHPYQPHTGSTISDYVSRNFLPV